VNIMTVGAFLVKLYKKKANRKFHSPMFWVILKIRFYLFPVSMKDHNVYITWKRLVRHKLELHYSELV
jgi:hypothetical protein